MLSILKKYKRKIIQFTIAIMYNLNLYGFKTVHIYQGKIKTVCVPGLNCYSCPGAVASCPVGSLQTIILSGRYKNNFLQKIPFYVIGFLVLFGVLFGRVICGFLCPFGLIQELLYKIPIKKIKKNKITAKLIYIKYFILVVFVVIIPIILFYPGFCKFICPAGTLEAGLFFVIINNSLRQSARTLFILKSIILIFVVVMSMIMFRFFCRFICPLGAIYSFFNKISFFGVKLNENKCIKCNLCIEHCLMDVKKVGDKECICCGECKKLCPTGAIQVSLLS